MTLRKVFHVLIALLLLSGAVLATQLTGCDAGARQARERLEAGQEAFGNNDIYGALTNLQQAREMAQQTGDLETSFEATVYLSLLYDQAGQSEKGYQLLKEVDYVEATTNPSAHSSQYYYRMMGIYSATLTHQYDSAIYYAQQAIELDKRLYPGIRAHVLVDMSNLAESYMNKGDSAQALRIVEQLKEEPPPKFKMYLCQVYYLYSLLSHNTDTAYHYAQLGRKLSAQYGSHDNEIACLKRLCALDSARRDIDAYITHQHAADSCIQQLQGSALTYKIGVLQEQNELERVEEKNRTDHIIGGMVIVMLALAVAALVTLLRMSRRNARNKQQLAVAAVQREKLQKELLQLRMKKSAEQLEQAQKQNVSMTEMITEMQHTLASSEEEPSLLALETTLKSQHADFLKRMESRYPELTANDIRLAGFIRMGVKPKVMAMALNISMRSMNTARYRLRKKLNLAPEDNLNDFIQSI